MDKFILALPRNKKLSLNKENEICRESSVKSLSCSHLPNKKRRVVQTCIDAGQKDLNQRLKCEMCSMLYIKGDDDDEREHRKHCLDFTHGPKLTTFDESLFHGDALCLTSSRDSNDRTIYVKRMDTGAKFSAFRKVLSTVQIDLGSTDEYVRTRKNNTVLYVLHTPIFLIFSDIERGSRWELFLFE